MARRQVIAEEPYHGDGYEEQLFRVMNMIPSLAVTDNFALWKRKVSEIIRTTAMPQQRAARAVWMKIVSGPQVLYERCLRTHGERQAPENLQELWTFLEASLEKKRASNEVITELRAIRAETAEELELKASGLLSELARFNSAELLKNGHDALLMKLPKETRKLIRGLVGDEAEGYPQRFWTHVRRVLRKEDGEEEPRPEQVPQPVISFAAQVCRFCKRSGHSKSDCPRRRRGPKTGCYGCGGSHFLEDCPHDRRAGRRGSMRGARQESDRRRRDRDRDQPESDHKRRDRDRSPRRPRHGDAAEAENFRRG